jgi:hypothetical protein
MPNCDAYQRLSEVEQIEFIGKICHLVQNDEFSFQLAISMLNKAEMKGLFKDVLINPKKRKLVPEPNY